MSMSRCLTKDTREKVTKAAYPMPITRRINKKNAGSNSTWYQLNVGGENEREKTRIPKWTGYLPGTLCLSPVNEGLSLNQSRTQ